MFEITNRCDAKDTRGVERCIKGRRESANIMQVTNNNFDTTRRQEMRCVLLLTCVAAPVLAVVFVSGYGFLVWMWQLISGPANSP